MPALDASELRARLRAARLMLVFTPELCSAPERMLELVLPAVCVLQIRVKASGGSSPAAQNMSWARRALELARELERPPLILQNDRVDVALALRDEGLAGVHLGADDCPPREARDLLGPDLLIGLSTHGVRDVARAEDEPVDYLGFGPIFPTRTKGYRRGLGPEAAWVAQTASARPVFPIGGIGPENAEELQQVGRAAVAGAVLGAHQPRRAIEELRALLTPPV